MTTNSSIEQIEGQIQAAHDLQSLLRNDPHRPTYHFVPPSAWMNDINGCLFWKGRYHIFYQYNPDGAYWHRIRWAHASSTDLLHWVHHPIALVPEEDGPERVGVFSGGSFVSKEGIPTLIYFGNPEGMCLAYSKDDLLIDWQKDANNPVIPQPLESSADFGCYTIHDPCGWLDGDTYYAAVNRRKPQGEGDGAYLFKSKDLKDWEFLGLFYHSRRKWTEEGEDCAVPDFFPLGDRHMLLFCSHLQGTQYYIGQIRDQLFYPDIHGRMSWEGGMLGGARTLLDANGRRVFFDWVREMRSVESQRESGWSGLMTVPRVLSLSDRGELLVEPVPELEALRLNHRRQDGIKLKADSEVEVDKIDGDCLELAIDIDLENAREVGMKVRRSPGGEEETAISYDAAAKVIRVDVSGSTLDPEIQYPRYRTALGHLSDSEQYVTAQEGPFQLRAGERLSLRIFLDRSVVEVFANGRQCVTQRIYPSRSDSTGVRLFARAGTAQVYSLEAWDMAPTY